MTYEEIKVNARKNMNGLCKLCPVCNGVACREVIPGPGARGTADSFVRSYNKLQEIKILTDTIYRSCPITAETELFGRKLRYPFLAGPIGVVDVYYGDRYHDAEYAMELLEGCAAAGIAAFTGDSPNPQTYFAPLPAVKQYGCGIPTFKPRTLENAVEKIRAAEQAGAFAVAMDIDTVGMSPMRGQNPPVEAKTTEQLAEIIAQTRLPFIIKGIMTVKGALKAVEAGASAIVVSNHGGRVMDQMPAPAEVLPSIVEAVGGRVKIMVDGGIRCGADLFKVMALGADLALIARPFVTAVYGGGAQGAAFYANQIGGELIDVMYMTGASNRAEISRDMLFFT